MTGHCPDPSDELFRRFSEAVSGPELDDLRELAGRLLTRGDQPPPAAPSGRPRPSLRRPRRAQPATYRLRVEIEGAMPPIWRRLDIRSDVRLDTLHQVLQAAFGWQDSHLHRFALGGGAFDRDAELFSCPHDEHESDDAGTPTREVRLDETLVEPGDMLRYCYDYGDAWDVVIALEAVCPTRASAPLAVCVDGRRAAPPEDCGGLRDEASLAEVLDDPARFDIGGVNQALIDPFVTLRESGAREELLDLVARLRGRRSGDALVARLLALLHDRPARTGDGERASALHPVLWFLDRVGEEGLALTAAGYLRPVDVSAAAREVPAATGWIGKANREVNTYPVLEFRECLQRIGLLRTHRGRLLLTKAGAAALGNPSQLWRHLAQRLPCGRPGGVEAHAGWVALLLAASSPDGHVPDDEVAEALTGLGWRGDGLEPVNAFSAHWAAWHTLAVLENLGRRTRKGIRTLTPAAADLATDALLGPQ